MRPYKIDANNITPMMVDKIVMGIPAFKYSLKLNLTPRFLADSGTIRLATDPSNVRLPAKVDVSASSSQNLSGSANDFIIGLITKTAGTLEIKLLNTTETVENTPVEW